MRKKLALLCGVASLGVLGLVGVANAAGSVSVDKSSGLVGIDFKSDPSNTVNATLSGFPSGAGVQSIAFASQCDKNDTDPTFDYLNDCTPSSNGVIDTTTGGTNPNVAGKGPLSVTVYNVDPNLQNWACVSANDVNLTTWASQGVPAGHVKSTCYIRATVGSDSNTTDDGFTPISFATTQNGPATPEAPYTILLPLGAGAVLAGGYVISRRRKPVAA